MSLRSLSERDFPIGISRTRNSVKNNIYGKCKYLQFLILTPKPSIVIW